MIVVLGDAMIDLHVYGVVERISPEAPVPIVRHRSDRAVPGGAGNVAVNIAALGSAVTLIGIVGDDKDGGQLAALLQESRVTFEPVIVPGRATSLKTRVMAGNQHILRIDREDVSAISRNVEDSILEQVEAALSEAKILAISDYAKGLLTDRVLEESIGLARKRDIPVVIDPKRHDFSRYAGAHLIKPNRLELAAASGMPCSTDEEVEQAAGMMCKRTGAALMVTRSEKGISYFAPHMRAIHMPTAAKAVFDVSGAGDTAFAVIAYGMANRLTVEQIMRLANLAAGIVVSKPGTATVSLEEIRAATANYEAHPVFRKGEIVSRESAMAIREGWRRQGLSVGFTNGCFDLLHPGHIAVLRGAARHCDRLVVGLNSDSSVSRLKGASRPIQSEAARAAVLSAIDCVDLVVVFEEETPLSLIEMLMPDVLVKGADYTEDRIVGADVVRAAGGRVERVELVAGQSTTDLIRRVAPGPTEATATSSVRPVDSSRRRVTI
ncbi:D-beta-D-heptose 7-phosphate kinase / D-beta-D-heptose 1-phosphate adenosyltransferase [Enhydrobacter aerosaccus]|uniref:Bifunctional protein HldE n=1 Tax=Enhydrobacter aerosaccus TaxID=225324 RepID=A0A1T4SC14_9HYPH|nr:D-glycero-beta-D-manno-heptose 1-phosphate adenylyltransferase [Enhydrobacter aerosaccus]SKA25717.1 D-beta-D-heptose 7-phosphate kinase / D-beta-D-heptose 1-phosphate adenosyltransferase [Enhydrobacter aerosaccus]